MKRTLNALWEKMCAHLKFDNKLDLEILEFHADQIELEKQPLQPALRSTLYIIVGIVLFAVLWSAVAKVDKIVVAEGHLIPTTQTIKIQPLENSIIKKFEVKVGEIVQSGQTLVRLDPTFAQADESRLTAREKILSLQISRLECELYDSDFTSQNIGEEHEEMLQNTLFLKRKDEYQSRISSFGSSIKELIIAIDSLVRQIEEGEKQLAILKKIHNLYNDLYKKQNSSLISLLNAQFQSESKISELTRLKSDMTEKKEAIRRIEAERSAFASKWSNDVLENLTTLRKERDSVREDLAKASRLHSLAALTAPESGVVLELGPFSEGSVARVGEAVMVLVPLNVPLEAEIFIDPSDIGYIRPGDTCRIKLDTFPFQKHGTLEGTLRTIGNDSVRPEGAELPKYKARVQLTKTKLTNVPEDFYLLPGMSLRTEVKVGTRRVITFFTYPLFRALDESLREP